MVKISQAHGPATYIKESGARYIGKLFSENELDRASKIANALDGMTIQEAEDLLDRVKCYLSQAVFCPDIG